MDNLQKKRLKKALSSLSDSFRAATKGIASIVDSALITMNEVMEAENTLAAVSDHDFVYVLRPVARELSELTGKPYVDILDQAREMILEGNNIPDVLYHFDRLHYNLKYDRK